MNLPIRLAIFISGGGTTMAAVIEACQNGVLKGLAEVVLVVASKDTASGIAKAEAAGIPVVVVCRKDFLTEDDYVNVLAGSCKDHKVRAIFMCGWLPHMPTDLIVKFAGRIFNQHPGPLRKNHLDFGGDGMYGIHVHAAVLKYIRQIQRPLRTEATVHRVTPIKDEGAVVQRIPCEVDIVNDTPEALQKRLLPFEHQAVIQTIMDLANHRIQELPDPKDLYLAHHAEITTLEWAKAEGVKYGKLPI